MVNLDALTYVSNLETLDSVSENPVTLRAGQIGDREVVDRLFAQYRPSAVVNFAAESHVDRSIDGPEPFVQTNVVENHELLEAALSTGGPRRGGPRRLPLPPCFDGRGVRHAGADGLLHRGESLPPNSPYAASKAASDHLVRAYHHTYGLPTLTTNCSNNYGPYHSPRNSYRS